MSGEGNWQDSTQSEQPQGPAEASDPPAEAQAPSVLKIHEPPQAHAESTWQPQGNGASQDGAASAVSSGNGHDAGEEMHEEATAIAELEPGGAPIDFDYNEQVPGYEPSASDCLNRALGIARSLNHTSLSADHLMLALTMDQNARRLLERVGDINALREMSMKQLGEMNWKFSRPAGQESQFPAQTSDLEDVRKMALHAASEREQRVAISDLIMRSRTRTAD